VSIDKFWSHLTLHLYPDFSSKRPAVDCCVYNMFQWKIFMGIVSFSGMWWSFVFGVRCLWRHNLTSYSCFQPNVLAKVFDIICIFFYTHSPCFMCHCTESKLSALQVRILEENKLDATTQQFITAKISGCALKQGSETHSSLRQSNSQLQNEAAPMSCRIRAVEGRKSVRLAGWRAPQCQAKFLTSAKFLTYCLSVTLLLRVKG